MTNPNISLEPRAAKLTKSGRVNTPKGRLAFVTIAEPKLAKRAKDGGARRDRTADLLHAMQALSQLSYGP